MTSLLSGKIRILQAFFFDQRLLFATCMCILPRAAILISGDSLRRKARQS